jgi:hypothetical protein
MSPTCTCESISPGMRNRLLPSIRRACGPATRFVLTPTIRLSRITTSAWRNGVGAFRRDQSDIFDHCAPIHNSLRVGSGPNIESD